MSEEAGGSAAEVLSQSDVEDILASLQPEEAPDEEIKVVGKGEIKSSSIQAYDFRSPVFLNPSQMRRLRIKHEDFIRGLGASLSLYLRMEFGLQMSRLETIAYKNLLEALPMPSHLVLFKLHPIEGVCLFEIAPRLGLTVIDRMMGGPGHSIKEEREFTDIEISVLENFIRLVIKEYAESWLRYQDLKYEITGHENTARFLNIVQEDEVMLYLEMEARLGDCVAGMRFIIPYRMIENLVEQLMEEISSESAKTNNRISLPKNLDSSVFNVPVPVSVHWRGHSLTLGEVQNLSVGDVLVLDPKACEKVVVDLGAVPKFVGQVNRKGRQVSVKVTSKSE